MDDDPSEHSILVEFSGIEPDPELAQKATKICDWVLHHKRHKASEVSLLFCSTSEIQEMNREFRSKDYPTDVLSFCQDEGEFPLGFQQSIHNLGDIAVAPDVVRNQALDFGVSYHEEMDRVIVHGMLHLLGQDHKTNEPHEPMLLEQERLLDQMAQEIQP